MSGQVGEYYIGDKVTFSGSFKVDGVEQTPVSCAVEIWKHDATVATVPSTPCTVVGNQVQYQYTIAEAADYTLFFTATFENGEARTGVIEFATKAKRSY